MYASLQTFIYTLHGTICVSQHRVCGEGYCIHTVKQLTNTCVPFSGKFNDM